MMGPRLCVPALRRVCLVEDASDVFRRLVQGKERTIYHSSILSPRQKPTSHFLPSLSASSNRPATCLRGFFVLKLWANLVFTRPGSPVACQLNTREASWRVKKSVRQNGSP